MSPRRGRRPHPDKAERAAVRRAQAVARLTTLGLTGPGVFVAHGIAANA